MFDNKTSNYWNTILSNGSQFQYGEVLQGDSGLDYKAYADLFANNSSDGGGNTASNYGKSVRAAISSGNLSTKMVQNIDTGGARKTSSSLGWSRMTTMPMATRNPRI